ncbi:hypothetical protein PanWU01x14_098170 [Parasponia andersonii]|uniref:Transmembrane protein n=1 Tax=Parasponia andersonii TaxID=3476 RepID=A0A2P5D3Z6_PARAD|nr:hypothetical protein PanWU01x14_098170 [Parasponia andersonii]
MSWNKTRIKSLFPKRNRNVSLIFRISKRGLNSTTLSYILVEFTLISMITFCHQFSICFSFCYCFCFVLFVTPAIILFLGNYFIFILFFFAHLYVIGNLAFVSY